MSEGLGPSEVSEQVGPVEPQKEGLSKVGIAAMQGVAPEVDPEAKGLEEEHKDQEEEKPKEPPAKPATRSGLSPRGMRAMQGLES